MASLYIAFNYVRRHLPKFLLICFCCAILISSAVLIPINNSLSNFGGFLQANSSKSSYSRLFFDTGDDVDYSSLAERYCGSIGVTGYTDLQDEEYCIGYADEIALDSLCVKLISGKLPAAENEIAVTDSILEKMNANIGDTVTLELTPDNPGQREFVITGTVNDYYSLFTKGEHQLVAPDDGDDTGFVRAFPRILCGKQNDYLQKNIVASAVCNYYAELDENYVEPRFSNNGFSVNNETSIMYYNSRNVSNADNIFSYVAAAAIIVGIFFGVYICVSLLINSEKSNNEILKNIGATKGLIKRVLLWQGLFISILASAVSVVCVLAVTEIFNLITVRSSLFRFNLSPNMLLILLSAAFVGVMVFFLYHILFKSSKNKLKAVKIGNAENVTFSTLWNKTVSKNAGTSKAAYSIVLAALVLLVTGGSFIADQNSISYKNNTDKNESGYDYIYFIGGGYQNRDYLAYNYPSYNGFTESETEKLASQYDLTVMAKGMATNINAYIFTSPDNALPFETDSDNIDVTDEIRNTIAKNDVGNFDKVYSCQVASLDYSTLKEMFPTLNISQSEYDSGERIISVDSAINSGKEFDLSFMFIPDEIISDTVDNNYIPEIITRHIKVTDSASPNPEKRYGYADKFTDGGYLLISDKYLCSISDKFRYSYVALNNNAELSESEEKELYDILSALGNEKQVQLSDYKIMKYNTDDAVSKSKMPFMISSVIFLVLSAMFAFICLNTDIKSKIRQISVARAIGADNSTLFGTLVANALKKAIPGYIIGFSMSAVLAVVIAVLSPQSAIPNLPYIDLLIYPIAVIAVISAVNLLAVFTAIKSVRKTDIYSAMARDVF